MSAGNEAIFAWTEVARHRFRRRVVEGLTCQFNHSGVPPPRSKTFGLRWLDTAFVGAWSTR